MTSLARLLAMVVLLVATVFACGKKEDEPPASTQPASPAARAAATDAPASASATATPPSAATPSAPAVPTASKTSPSTQAPAPPPATSTPPPTTQPERPAATPSSPARPTAVRPKGKITLPAKLGAVTFDHEEHAGKLGAACTTCHHPSRPQKPLASENQACRDCHATPLVAPMKTSLQSAFHDPKGATGTCIDCHRKKGGSAPVKCLECHKKK